MEAIKMIKTRRSVRNFTEEKVSEDVLKKIVDAARFAPSWANFQVARYHFVQDTNMIAEIADKGVNRFVYNIDTLRQASNVLVVTYVSGKSGKLDLEVEDYSTSKQSSWEIFDAGIATQTFCLAAHANKISTCIMGVIDDKSIAEIINLPSDQAVAALVVLGYSDEDDEIEVPTRHSVEDLTKFY